MKTPLQKNSFTCDQESPSLFTQMGGLDICQQLVATFFRHVDDDPILLAIYGHHHRCAIEGLTRYLVQLFGGRPEYAEKGNYLSLIEAHTRFKIGQTERDAWLAAMHKALDEVPLDESLRAVLREFFAYSSTAIINRPPAASPSNATKSPPNTPLEREVESLWQAQLQIEEIVGAVRNSDASRVLALLASDPVKTYLQSEKAIFASVLATLGSGGNSVLLDYLREQIAQTPELLTLRCAMRGTLLHSAAAAGCPQFVTLLLEFGANPNAVDGGGHTPLYSACNATEGREDERAEVVRLLAESGADVNANHGVKRCAPLHMAARRGSVSVANVLLEYGADIEARDSDGDTPLRRAINCGKPEAAAFLLSRGAELHSKGSGGLEAWQAARTARMKQVLQDYLAQEPPPEL